MSKRVRHRRHGWVPAAVYWPLFRLSPLIMLGGMAAGGWLCVRSILVWGTGKPEYQFGADIPLSAVVLALWAFAALVLVQPPRQVCARVGEAAATPRLVWPLGARFRTWNVLAAPVCGVLAIMAFGLLEAMLTWDYFDPITVWVGLPFCLALIVFSLALIWIVARSIWLGVELTPTHLIARGYLRSRRYPRESIVSVNAVQLPGWMNFALSTFLNVSDVSHSLQLSLEDHSEPMLLASNSWRYDVMTGADIIRSWRSDLA